MSSTAPRSEHSTTEAAAIAPLTPDLSKRARRELGLSQNDVIKASGVQAYKLKQWEGRGLSIELADIRKLTEFYEGQGVDLAELREHILRSSGAGGLAPAATGGTARQTLQDGFTYTPRPGFMISDKLSAELVDQLMERMEANDDKIGALTGEAVRAGFFGGISDETEAKASALIGALAENHIIFRFLQGRHIITPTSDEPRILGNYLAKLMAESPALPLIAEAHAAQQPTTEELAE